MSTPTSSGSPAKQPAPCAVVGGGLAGSSLALLLARAGHSVTLLEQHRTPRHKVCGDFLSAEALLSLDHLGLSPASLGAVPLTTVRLAQGHRLAEAPLPFAASSLTRFTLDEALLQRAASTPGVTLLRGHRVESLTPDLSSRPERSAVERPASGPATPFHLTLSTGKTLTPETVFLCTGKHDLRGHPRPPGRHSSLVAFKLYLRLSPAQHRALGPSIELTLFPHGYAGLQPVEPDATGPRANLCLVLEQPFLRRLGGTWPALLQHLLRTVPHLALRIADAEPLLPRPLALSRIPYGLLLSEPPAPHLWPLGDQAVVIPSLTGDGMSLALHTARLAAETFLAGEPASAYLDTLHRTLRAQLTLSTLLSRLAVHPALQPALGLAVSAAPSLLARLATATRIPAAARLSAPDLTLFPSAADRAARDGSTPIGIPAP